MPKVWKFWEILLFQLLSTANLIPLAFLNNFKVFFGKLIFSCKKTNFWKFWEISLFRSHSTSNWLTVSDAVDIKLAKFSCFQNFRFLFRKNHLSFKNPNFRVILLFHSTCGKFATFGILTKTFKIFSRKPHLFIKKNTIFERFEKSYCLTRIQQRNWYL